MSKDYFTPVDLDAAFPAPVEEVKVPSIDPAAVKAKEEYIGIALRDINQELQRVRSGSSKYVVSAQQFNESKTPFCIALKNLNQSTKTADAFIMIALARQDFGEKFANFVIECFKPIYGDK